MSTPAVDARQHSLDETPARQHTPARPPPSRSPSGGPLASTSASQRSMSGSTSLGTGAGGGPGTAASHLTLEAALAGANGSHAAALDTVLAERNMLSSQNAQLWKLIEKQRASYANAMKDLERIRGERDKAIARLDGSRGPRRQHSTPQKSSSASALPSSSSSRDSPSTETTPKPSSDPPSTNGAPPAQADSTRSSPNLDDAASVVAYSIAEQPEPEPESATPAVKQPPSIITTLPTTPTRHPASAEAVSATPVNAADPTRPLHIATKKHSLDSHTGPSAGSPSTQTQISASNMLMPFNDSKRAKRESRISIPPEARNYIQHMDDLPSPNHSMSNLSNVSSSSVNVSTSSLNGYGKESLSPVAENPRQRAVSSPERPLEGSRSQSTTPPFLDMDNSEDEDDAVPSAPSTVTTAPIPLGQARQAPTYATSSTTSPEPAPSFTFSDDTRGPSASSSTSPADDYVPGRSQQSFAQQQQTSGPRQQQFDLSTPPNSPPVTQTAASTSSSRAGMFRAQRLIHSDLAQTNIRIAGSNIRANDRGKEVLSFVIAIAPGNKERYKVEKLYGDVLALDGRVRAAMSRSQLKALAPLPDAKLFKDHAPAKVDARKAALEKYLQALVRAPMKNTDDLCAFLSSDVVRDTKAPVMQSGHKEGYLTKRGKNFGGWKTRFFVLQNSTLEYYESRGGTHLGSIVITGAQIGRQQRPQQSRADDDDNEFRHAFLIIEAKRGPGGQSPRHVLCAESDAERDAWVEVLVRYVTGAYDESSGGGQSSSVSNTAVPRSSTSSYDSSSVKRPRMSKDEISKGSAVPIAQLQIDSHNQKLFQSAPSISEAGSPVGTSPDKSPAHAHSQDSLARKMLDRSGSHPHNGSDISLSSSVPSYLDVAGHPAQRPHPHQGALTPRSASELGHYPDLKGPPPQGYGQSGLHNIERPSSQPSRSTQQQRASYHPSLSTVHSSPTSDRPPQGERAVSPDLLTPRAEQSRSEPPRQAPAPAPAPGPEQPRTTKISGPMNGKPIPAGYNFGGSLNQVPTQAPAPAPESLAPPSDRKGKVASRFWQFGRGDKNPVAAPVPTQMPRAVFGVTLEDSLAVAQIAKLPAIVFRCIQYLEAKRADQEEGIYRLSGSSAVIKNLRDRFNAEGDVDLLASDEFWDPHAIAGLLKSFLRDLPASILTRDLHLRFLHVIDLMDPQERVSELQSLISMLPLANYSLLRALTAHLILIVQNSNVNKMTMRNVGIVFSPTLGIPAGVFSLMLGEFNRVFSVEPDQRAEEVEENPADPSAAAASQLSRRNSRHYADAAADQMLGLTGRSLGADADESDDGDELLSVHEESGAETENEADVTLTLESQSSGGGDGESYHTHQSHQHGAPPQVFVDQHPGHARPGEHAAGARAQKAANVAASRGLQVNVAGARVANNMAGLPASPRPRGPMTPTTASNPATPR